MGKRATPRGVTKKTKCKCGKYFYPKLIGSSMKLTEVCVVCNPKLYREEKK